MYIGKWLASCEQLFWGLVVSDLDKVDMKIEMLFELKPEVGLSRSP